MSLVLHTDASASQYISLAQAAQQIPGRPSIQSVNRWSLRGVRGVRLRTIRAGGGVYTPAESVAEFLRELNESADERLAGDGC